jgi:hypothetical protein
LVNNQFAEVSYSESKIGYSSFTENKKATKKKRKRNAKRQFKKQGKNIKYKTQFEWIEPIGITILISGGLILSALFIYLGTLFIPWFVGLNIGCSSTFLSVLLVSLAWIGWIYLGILALVLLVVGIYILSFS